MHDYHENLPGYSEAQILHDGCEECERRSQSRGFGIGGLDRFRFARAWRRAADWNRGKVHDIAKAEIPMLDALWAVQCRLEDFGIPIGQVPHD